MVRNHFYIKHIGMIVALLGHLSQVEAQISQGGQPFSFSSAVTDSIAIHTMAALDVASLMAEDELEAILDSPPPPPLRLRVRCEHGSGQFRHLDQSAQW